MKKLRLTLTVCFIIVMAATAADAIPQLQLGIPGGSYNADPDVETTIAGDTAFMLNAYLYADGSINGNSASLSDTFFISAAVFPKYGPTDGDLGSFMFGGVTYSVTGDMDYGTPPIEAAKQDNLAGHGVYDTYFRVFDFTFSGSSTDAFNVQDFSSGSGEMYYQSFAVNTANLDPDYFIHFDLYTVDADGAVKAFAPFSHDAQSNGHRVPEPASVWLIGMGLLGLGFYGRKKIS